MPTRRFAQLMAESRARRGVPTPEPIVEVTDSGMLGRDYARRHPGMSITSACVVAAGHADPTAFMDGFTAERNQNHRAAPGLWMSGEPRTR